MCGSATEPLVSVLVPAYNASQYLEETLVSVTSQTYRKLEVLIVDDGSTDATPQIARLFEKRDSRITVLQQNNEGVGSARNLAIKHARGEFIAPIDADDIWYPEKIEKQVRCALHANPNTGLIYAWTAQINDEGTVLGYSSHDVEGDVYLDLLCSNFIGNASVPLIRRLCVERAGGYNQQFKRWDAQGCEDWDLYLRLAERFEFRVVPQILVGYRSSAESMSHNYLAMERSYLAMIRDLRARNPDVPDAILRLSMSGFYSYLLGKMTRAGDFRTAAFWLLKSVQLDPTRLLWTRWYKLAAVCAIRILSKNFAADLAAGNRPWRKARRKESTGSPRREPASAGPLDAEFRHPSLYDRLRKFRQRSYRNRWLGSLRTRIALEQAGIPLGAR